MTRRLTTLLVNFLLITFFCFLVDSALAQNGGKKSGARIQRTNWQNTMGCTYDSTLCVYLYSDNTLVFRLLARFSDPNVSNYPPMHFYYFFPDYNVQGAPLYGHTPKVSNPMVYPIVLETGENAWEAAFTIEIDLGEHCGSQESFPFGVEYQLVSKTKSGTYFPYPVFSYPDLFLADIFDIGPTGWARYETYKKTICCYSHSYVCPEDPLRNVEEDQVFLSRSTNPGGAKESLDAEIFPNPFSDELTLQLNAGAHNNTLNLLVYNANGEVMEQLQTNGTKGYWNAMISTSDWPPGIYFVKITTTEESILMKSIKY